jgi:hypothetical protein
VLLCSKGFVHAWTLSLTGITRRKKEICTGEVLNAADDNAVLLRCCFDT